MVKYDERNSYVMNKKRRLQLGVALLVITATGGISAAAPSQPALSPPGSTLEQRIAQRKTEQGTALNKVEVQRIMSACVSAQTKLRGLQSGEDKNLATHEQIYSTIDAKLWITIGQLKLAAKDTAPLEKQRLLLVDKTANFRSLASSYKQALSDSLSIDCKIDPNGFKALLDTTRAYYDQLRAQSADSHSFITKTVKDSLGGYVTGLQSKDASSRGN